MPGKSVLDNYSQKAILGVQNTAAVSGTVITQLTTGLTNIQKVAWAVESIEFTIPSIFLANMQSYQDFVTLALTQSNNANQYLDERGQSVIDWIRRTGERISIGGGAATATIQREHVDDPTIHVFPSPRLVLPQNLFAALQWSTTGAPGASRCAIVVNYKEVEVGPEDFYDLLQLRLPLGGV